MPRWVSQTCRERANVRAEQKFGRAIQGVPGDNILFHVYHEIPPSTTRTNLDIDRNALSQSILDLTDRIICVSIEYLEVLDLLLGKERAGHRTMELPRGTVRIEDSMTKKGTHEPMESLSCNAVQPHFRWTALNGGKPFPNFSKLVASISCHDERKCTIVREPKPRCGGTKDKP